jgi:hypothetical protein
MKTFSTIALGAGAIVGTLTIAQPAMARDDVGVYVGPLGFGVNVDDGYRSYCGDEWYRRDHWSYCSRYYRDYDYDDYYRNSGYYYFDGRYYRYDDDDW